MTKATSKAKASADKAESGKTVKKVTSSTTDERRAQGADEHKEEEDHKEQEEQEEQEEEQDRIEHEEAANGEVRYTYL